MPGLVAAVVIAVLILTLPMIGFLIGGALSAGKVEDAWNEGYQAGFKDGSRRSAPFG